jgi:hypothetical protein
VRAALAALFTSLPVLAAQHAKPTAQHAKATASHASSTASHGAPHVPVHFAPPLPMLASISRVRVEVGHDRAVVVEDVSLPRGDWTAGALDLYAAFGSPGTPIAVDAHLYALPEGQAEPRADDAGDGVSVEPAIRHTPSSQLLLGRPTMAGVVLHVGSDLLRRTYGAANVALLRIRSLLSPPGADAGGGQSVVVRLGIAGGLPLTLNKVQVVSVEPKVPIQRAEATLCGPDADARPLSLSVVPRLPEAPWWDPVTIAPAMATRHASDDLCVRWWSADHGS